MKYKAIVSDFDGTLVGKTQQLSPQVAEAIQTYTSEGGIFSVATGRDFYGLLKKIAQQLELDHLHITRGGSEIISGKTEEIVWAQYMPPETLTTLLTYLSKKIWYIFCSRERSVYLHP